MIGGVLCQRKQLGSIYDLDANFNSFPFVDDAGNFTIDNMGSVVLGQDGGFTFATFNKTSGQKLKFVGTIPFNLQGDLQIECMVRNNSIGEGPHTLFELVGENSYLGLTMFNNSAYGLYLTGAINGNTDNYAVGGSTNIPYENFAPLKIVYNATLGTLKTYVYDILDINVSGVTPRLNEPRVMYLSGFAANPLKAWVDYFRVLIGAGAGLGIERWFKFDGDLVNSGTLPCTASLTGGSVTYTTTNANTGQAIVPTSPIITTTPLYALGANFYVEFYATWTDDGLFNTVVSSTSNGFNIAKTAFLTGRLQVQVGGVERLRSVVGYADGIKRKFKITFIAGEIALYVNDVLTSVGGTPLTNFTSSESTLLLLNGTGGGAQSGQYDDLIIHRPSTLTPTPTVVPSLLTMLLMHFDGADNTTTLIDSSGRNNTIVPTGNPLLTTSDSKFGGACLQPLSGRYFQINATPNFDIGSAQPFTIAFWFNPLTTANSGGIVSMRTGATYCPVEIYTNGGGRLIIRMGNAALNNWLYAGVTGTPDVWNHFAMVGDGNNIKFYHNGGFISTIAQPSWPAQTSYPLVVNKDGDGNTNYGVKLDELVFQKQALWTAEFTPPVAAYS